MTYEEVWRALGLEDPEVFRQARLVANAVAWHQHRPEDYNEHRRLAEMEVQARGTGRTTAMTCRAVAHVSTGGIAVMAGSTEEFTRSLVTVVMTNARRCRVHARTWDLHAKVPPNINVVMLPVMAQRWGPTARLFMDHYRYDQARADLFESRRCG